MVCCGKSLVRVGVIGALVGGTAFLIAGPDRVGALLTQAKNGINCTIDRQIGDPVALRSQLRSLEAEYPARIESVKGDLAELRAQASALKRQLDETRMVVSLADQDQQTLTAQLSRAEAAITPVSFGEQDDAEVVIVFRNQRLDLEDAQAKAEQAAATKGAYASRAVEIQRSLDLLAQQESRLVSILNKLETERTQFQTQLWNIDQEVDTIARNDRMIDLVGKWQKSVDSQSRYRGTSLDGIKSQLAQVRARQEARLEALSQTASRNTYEERARIELDRRNASDRDAVETAPAKPTRRVIEIHPEDQVGPRQLSSSAGAR